jgi:DNA primase catalytic core
MKTDFDQIKRTTDIVRVVESYGVKLKKVGRNHVGRCCFHADKNPSLIVTADKGLFHCPACGAAGNVIQFVARKEGISEREAAVKLLGSVPGVKVAARVAAPPATTAPAPQLSPGESAKLLQRVAAFYARTLHKDRAGLDYLKSRKLDEPAMLEVFQVGYANGTLPGVLPKSGEIIDGLKTLGVLNAKGQEHFRGCVTVPIFDSQGNVCGIYGRKAEPSPNAASPRHLYLPGPRRGVWNGIAARTNQTLFVTEAIFDGMSLWQAGFKNVLALYGANGWTTDHEQLLKANGTTEIYLCLDNDESGRAATERLKGELLAEGHHAPPLVKAVHVVNWPEGVKDAADFFLSREPKDFETLVKAATPNTATAPVSEQTTEASQEKIEMTPDGFVASYGPRRYELRAIERPNAARLRASVKAVHEGRFHIDMVDFYLSRSRRVFIGEAARLFRETAEVIEADVNRLITQLETYAQKQLAETGSQVVLVNEAEKAEGLKLGRHPDLVAEVLRDLEKLGLVGELTNKLMGYLVMTSRKMDDPLALLILSGSGAGKSLLQDALLKLCPDEDLVKLTSLSDRALFYKGEDSLKNKVLAVEEVAGAEGAYYAIRNLISAKKLTIETTVKNALTGQLTTQVNTVNGPTAVFQTTTQPDLDAETKSRFIITSIDESLEQTRAILAAQRQSHTLEGLRRKKQREAIVRRHHAFQRLLQPLLVVNPFEPLLTYAEDHLLVRRDNPKYLHLILAVTFLHQLQRPARHDGEFGGYIETTLDDIAIANELATSLFGQSLDELSRPGRELLQLIFDYMQSQAAKLKTTADKIAFGRRELREALKWSEYQLRTYLDELEKLEYVWPLAGRQGQPFRYRLLWDGQGESGGRFLPGLKSVEQLRQDAEKLGMAFEQGGCRLRLPSSRKIQLRGEKVNFEGTSLNGSHEVKPEAKADEQRILCNGAPASGDFSGSIYPGLRKTAGNGSRVSVAAGGRV